MKIFLSIFLVIFLYSISFCQSYNNEISKEIKTIEFDCNLTYLTTIEGYDVYLHNTSGAILYRAKFAVDADGCPRAYGPDNTGLDWTANAGYPGNWWGIVTDANGDPIIQNESEPYPGMYVSSTSLVRAGYPDTVTARYVDSENIPYIALPYALQTLANISKGDLAYVRNTTNGNTCFAYFADTGPTGKLGEGSIYLADQIGLNSSPRTGGTSLEIIDYIVFPQSGFGQGTHLSREEIDSIGQYYLDAAGGIGLPDCIDSQAPELICDNPIVLYNGEMYSGNSSSALSNIGTYGCNTWTETGPERVHIITPQYDCILTATISNFTGDLDVYILGSCDPMDCLGTVSSSSAVYSEAHVGEDYYIVVDADDGSGSSYDIIVTCEEIVGVNFNENKTERILYPNPTFGTVYIQDINYIIAEVEIWNNYGQMLKSSKIINNSINLKEFPSGVYIIKLRDKQQNVSMYRISKI